MKTVGDKQQSSSHINQGVIVHRFPLPSLHICLVSRLPTLLPFYFLLAFFPSNPPLRKIMQVFCFQEQKTTPAQITHQRHDAELSWYCISSRQWISSFSKTDALFAHLVLHIIQGDRNFCSQVKSDCSFPLNIRSFAVR